MQANQQQKHGDKKSEKKKILKFKKKKNTIRSCANAVDFTFWRTN